MTQEGLISRPNLVCRLSWDPPEACFFTLPMFNVKVIIAKVKEMLSENLRRTWQSTPHLVCGLVLVSGSHRSLSSSEPLVKCQDHHGLKKKSRQLLKKNEINLSGAFVFVNSPKCLTNIVWFCFLISLASKCS